MVGSDQNSNSSKPVTYKNEEDQIKNEGARVATTFLPLQVYGDYSRRSIAANSTVPSENWAISSKLYGCPHYKFQSKMKALEWSQL